MIGRWEGAGVVGYPTIESVNFGQEVECRHDGRNFLEWHSHTWLLDQETGEKVRPLATELGFWRPVEDGREVELLLAHPTGIVEIYYGKRSRPGSRCEPTASSAARWPRSTTPAPGSTAWWSPSCSGSWTWRPSGQELQSHVSAQLKRVG